MQYFLKKLSKRFAYGTAAVGTALLSTVFMTSTTDEVGQTRVDVLDFGVPSAYADVIVSRPPGDGGSDGGADGADGVGTGDTCDSPGGPGDCEGW